jgi:amidase
MRTSSDIRDLMSEPAGPAVAAARRFDRAGSTLFFDPAGTPVAEVADGERFLVETADSVCGLAKREAPRGWAIDDLLDRLGGACPLTGPFHVTGARRGDALVVRLHDVRLDPAEGTAWTAVFTGFGALAQERYTLQPGFDPETRLLPYRAGVARLPITGRDVELPLRPFLGAVGVAPARERRMTFSQDAEYLGDVDLPALGAGAELVLPVNVDGGLLSLGDGHAAQGDGEITGAAVEVECVVDVSVHVRDRDEVGYVALPQLNTAERIGSIAGLQGSGLTDCARAAYADLARRLTRHHGMSTNDAYLLLGQAGRLAVGNMIDPFYSVLASLDRRFL